jgi:hypothetical protein
MDLTSDERRQVEDAVVAALKALLDLPIDLKCVVVDLIVDRVQMELALLAASASRAGELTRDVISSPSMDENDRARLDRHEKALADLKTMALSLAERVLVVESLTDGIPLSTADHLIARRALAGRRAPHEEVRLRVRAFRRAQAEAETTGSREPIDRFLQRLKAGEFDASIRSRVDGYARKKDRRT